MLTFHTPTKAQIVTAADAKTIPADVNWVDALRPTEEEISFLERTLGIEVPNLQSLSEVQSSSRLRTEKDWLRISIPMIYRPEGFMPSLTPLGLLLSKDLLLTVRFKQMKAFDNCEDDLARYPLQAGGPGALASLLEVIIDHAADTLEGAAGDLERLSEQIFSTHQNDVKRRGPREDSRRLRVIMRKLGVCGDLSSKVEDVLLGTARMLPYVTTNAAPYLDADMRKKLKSLQGDIDSLKDYETDLTDKIHFLLDATLGLTNVEQNNIFRILTVVSVVGIPPDLLC